MILNAQTIDQVKKQLKDKSISQDDVRKIVRDKGLSDKEIEIEQRSIGIDSDNTIILDQDRLSNQNNDYENIDNTIDS